MISFYIYSKKHGGFTTLLDKSASHILNYGSWSIKKGAHSAIYVYSSKYGYLHRLVVGAKKGDVVDHINGDGLDNRIQNLRICSCKQNLQNQQKTTKKCSSSYKGVSFCKFTNKWRAYISANNKRLCLGRFDSEADAALAYNKKATALHGEYARLNIV